MTYNPAYEVRHIIRDVGDAIGHSFPDSSCPKFANHALHLERIAISNQKRGFPVAYATRPPEPRPLTLRAIAEEVAFDRFISVADLIGKSRKDRHARPRHEFMWRARQVRQEDGSHRYSLMQIAQFLGMTDHTSIMHGVREHEKRMAQSGGAE